MQVNRLNPVKRLFNNFVPGITKSLFVYFLIMPAFIFFSCGNTNNTSKNKTKTSPQAKVKISIPSFNTDTAYHYIEKQISFGPRVPGTEAHAACAQWIKQTLTRFTDDVIVQDFKARVFDNRIFEGKNIIASFNPDIQNRIFLSAHWDSRPFADHDPDEENHLTPIDGANDGASGTGILIEIARQLSLQNPNIGIDIILFDLEDFGSPQDKQTNESTDTWGLGSQYWSKNFHRPGYSAKYGILLDMVGAENARFPLEGFSMYFAPDITKKVWGIAADAGYGDYFVSETGGYITDDHYFINKLANIPTIDIVHLDPASVNGTFYDHWHTINDNLDQIEPETLKAVGQTVLTVIFSE